MSVTALIAVLAALLAAYAMRLLADDERMAVMPGGAE